MNEPGTTIRESILEQVFPGLRYGGDPDIERYFDLRSAGRMMEALSVYKARIRPRYPDEVERILLLKLYRTRSPGFSTLLHTLLNRQVDTIIARIIRNIDALIAPLAGVSMKNTYGVLKAVETIARLLPDDAGKARNVADTHHDYAKMLGHRLKEMQQICYLLGEFYDQASIDDNEGVDFIASSLAAEEERRSMEAEREKKNFFDLSRIEFDATDVRRMEIPSSLTRDEDIVLAYCHKYWLTVEDPAFERIVWLYARKYGTRHFEVFRAIKTGRRRKYSDDDILSLVATTIATRYNYTVQGDLYMQATWKRLKAAMYAAVSPIRPPARTATPTRTTSAAHPAAQTLLIHQSGHPASRLPSPVRASVQPSVPAPARPPVTAATGSVSDVIKRLSGRSYDVYRNIFLAKARPAIREVLLRQPNRPASLFGEELNEAENLIHEFLERNYANPYMDWKASDQYARMGATGYQLENLEVVIEASYKRIN
ncbi:MAG: hypothetical protein ABIJ86_15140 [Spirochaetota bacterium]